MSNLQTNPQEAVRIGPGELRNLFAAEAVLLALALGLVVAGLRVTGSELGYRLLLTAHAVLLLQIVILLGALLCHQVHRCDPESGES